MGFGPMRNSLGVRFSFAGTAFLNRYADRLEGLSLTPGRVLALSFLHEHPGCEQKVLARGLVINEASAMTVIDRLEALGYVERRAGHNKRSNALYLTDQGEAAFQEALSIEKRLADDVFGWMSKSEISRFIATLDTIRERASAASAEDRHAQALRPRNRRVRS